MDERRTQRNRRAVGSLRRLGGGWVDGALALALGGLLGALAAHFEGEAHALTCPKPDDREFWHLERVELSSPSGGDVQGEAGRWLQTANLSAGTNGTYAATDALDRCDTLELEEAAP